MPTLWFCLIAGMLATYVALDGFDFGVGMAHLLVAKSDVERRTTLAAIGPVWDGNEVWLVASGGVLVFAFPRAYSAGFSGFYLPLMMALWLLVLRGISIEFRSRQANPLWREFWDGMFGLSSALMTIILGAALGCVIRGVPLQASGFFQGPLFTNFRPGSAPGVLDWYTVLVGLFTLTMLAGHGTMYLIWRTGGEVQRRSVKLAARFWAAAVVVGLLTTYATSQVQPALFHRIFARPAGWLLTVVAIAALGGVIISLLRKLELAGFLASSALLVGMLGATLCGLYPDLLLSTLNPAYDLTVQNASTGSVALSTGIIWWSIAILLAIGYFAYLFRSFHGKVQPDEEGHGY